MQKENEFKNIFSNRTTQPSIDTIRDTVKVIETDGLKSILQHTVKRAITNKVFVNGTIDGYTVAAIDGTKVFGSNKKCCEKCLTAFIAYSGTSGHPNRKHPDTCQFLPF